MTIPWVVYTLVVSALLYAGARGAEFVCRAARVPTRFVWGFALALAAGLSTRAVLTPQEPANALSVTSNVTTVATPVASREASAIVSATAPVKETGVVAIIAAFLRDAADAPARSISTLVSVLPTYLNSLISLAVTFAAIAGVAYLCVVVFRVRRVVGSLQPHAHDGNEIFVSRRFGPALLGIIKPRVVVPRWVLSLSHRQRSIIVMHEQQHALVYDPVLLSLGGVLVALMPWNVFAWLTFARLRLAIEVDCDGRVLQRHGNAHEYGDLLVTVYQRASASGWQPAFAHGPSNLEHRILRMMDSAPRLLSTRGAVALVTAAALAAIACETSAPTPTFSGAAPAASSSEPVTASVVGNLPRCIAGGRSDQSPRDWFEEIRSVARQHYPAVFGDARANDVVIALVLDEQCAVRRDTLIVSSNGKRGDLAYPYFARIFGDSAAARRRVGMTWDLRSKLTIAYAVKPSQSWELRTQRTPCGIGIRFDEHCVVQGPTEIRQLDSLHALLAVRDFNAPRSPTKELFLITFAHPSSALATRSLAHGVVGYQSGAVFVDNLLAREPRLWIGTSSSTGLQSVKRLPEVRIIDGLVGIAHYSGHPLTLEQVAQLHPSTKCDGPTGSCYEAGGTEIKFP